MTTKLTMIRHPVRWKLVPHGTVAEDIFETLPKAKPFLVTVTQPRNIEHLQKFWVLANKVADFHPEFLNGEDAVRWAKRKLGMFKSWTLDDGRLVVELESIAVESMDQLAFTEFYNHCLDMWAGEIDCDPEELTRR